MTLGVLLGCGPTPSEVVGTADGSTGSSTGTGSTSGVPMPGSSSPGEPGADGSGDATSQSVDTDSDGTTQGVQLATSTGEAASTSAATSTGEAASTSTDPAGTSTGEDPGPSCDELFGAAPGYIYCMETPAACYFNANTGGSNCNAMCTMLGSDCVEAFDNPNEAGQECVVIAGSMDTCDTNRGTELCACSK
jgi:hypothetical protein